MELINKFVIIIIIIEPEEVEKTTQKEILGRLILNQK